MYEFLVSAVLIAIAVDVARYIIERVDADRTLKSVEDAVSPPPKDKVDDMVSWFFAQEDPVKDVHRPHMRSPRRRRCDRYQRRRPHVPSTSWRWH